MKLETNSELVERLLREAKETGSKVEGRTLPKGYQWNGIDTIGHGSAQKRRLRQLERREAKKK